MLNMNYCKPEDIALKSFFLGPQAENAAWIHELVLHLFRRWYQWRKEIYADDGVAITEDDQFTALFMEKKDHFRDVVDEIIDRFEDEVPSFSPRYVGHMINEISLPALLGHIITLQHNPNNISSEISRVGMQVEMDAVKTLMEMTGYDPESGFGHFTSGGSVANLESVLRARSRMYNWLAAGAAAWKKGLFDGNLFEAAQMGWQKFDELASNLSNEETIPFHFLKNNPFECASKLEELFGCKWAGSVMLVPANKHYSWNKAAGITGIGEEGFWPVSTDGTGRLCVDDLREKLGQAAKQQRPVMMVVSVAGTTELGEFDPVDKVQAVLDEWKEENGIHIWHHVDAAYGGFFCTLMEKTEGQVLDAEVIRALKAMRLANSLTIDPHKLGYVPYSSGAFLCKDLREYNHMEINAPYLMFREKKEVNEPGPQTLEGSRSAAGAVSTWLTARVIGFNEQGYGRILERSVDSAQKLGRMLTLADSRIRVNPSGDCNIITFCVAGEGERLSETNARSLRIYEAFSPKANHSFVVSKTTLGVKDYGRLIKEFTGRWNANHDVDDLVLIRLVLMNPFFETVESKFSYPDLFVSEIAEFLRRDGSG